MQMYKLPTTHMDMRKMSFEAQPENQEANCVVSHETDPTPGGVT